MGRIIFDENIIKYISLVESLTGAKVKDCIVHDERIIFIIKETDIGKAIGKKGSHIHRIEHLLKKKVKMVEFSDNEAQFIRNFLYPIEVRDVQREEDVIIITGNDVKTKGLIIGRDKVNLNFLSEIMKRYFKFNSLKVV